MTFFNLIVLWIVFIIFLLTVCGFKYFSHYILGVEFPRDTRYPNYTTARAFQQR